MNERKLNFAEQAVQVLTLEEPGRMDIPQVLPQSLALFETMYDEIQ